MQSLPFFSTTTPSGLREMGVCRGESMERMDGCYTQTHTHVHDIHTHTFTEI